MARIFISHSHANNAEALALRDWLVARGWDDLFLDIDPHRGLVSGQRWLDRLQVNAHRCKAVLFVLSQAWLASRYCTAEFWEARKKERPLFAVVIDDTAVSEVPAEMCGVWQLAFLTRGSRFKTFLVQPPPDYVPTEVRFSHEGLESLRLGLTQAGLTSFDTESFPWPSRDFEHEADGTTPRRPYRGLKPVDAPDAGVFFGRDADLVRARDHLADLRDRGGRCLVVLLGASGSGKSSFLRAGLLPRLARDDRRFVPLPVLRPREAAMWGEEGLLAGLETAHRKAGLAVPRAVLRADLEAGGAGFLRRLADLRAAAAQGLPEGVKPPTLVLPIDQAEELFATVHDDRRGETSLFLLRLEEVLHHGPEALALVTIRSDAYEPLQTAGELAGVSQIPFNLPPLAAANYRSVIEGPAHRVSAADRPLALEPELVAALLADAQGADALPLLGFTLERLYNEHGGGGALTLDDYRALDGVQGSIEAAVAEALAAPEAAPRIPANAAEREALLKPAFVPHLMGVNEANGEPVRRTARRADLPETARGLIDRLIAQRLLVADRRGEEIVIEVAHEALLRRWPTLRRWHDQERAALVTQQEIARAASAWSQNAGGADWLAHRGARLEGAEKIARREDFAAAFKGVPRAYLEACRQAEDATRDAEARRMVRQRAMQRRVSILLTMVAIVTLAGSWLVMAGRRDLARQRSGLIAGNAQDAFKDGFHDRALRLALAASQGSWSVPVAVDAGILLGHAAHFSRLEAQLTVCRGQVRSAAFSPDGDRIVTTSLCFDTTNPLVDSPALVWSRAADGSWNKIPLQGHQGYVNSAVFSPDSARIVTASADKTARVWSRGQDGSWSSVSLQGHQDSVNSAVFSPDGARIVTASTDKTARVWSRGQDGSWSSISLQGHQDSVNSAAFSPDGVNIITASTDRNVRVWSQGQDGSWNSVTLQGHQHSITSAVFSPAGDRIVIASLDNTAHVWSRGQDGSWSSIPLQGHQGSINSAAFSPDSDRIVTASDDKTARIWSRDQDGSWSSVILQGHQFSINSAAFSPDGDRIVTAANDDTARVWNRVRDGSWYSVTLQGSRESVTSAAFSPGGDRIVTASLDNTVYVWSRGQGGSWSSVPLQGHQGPIRSAAFSPTGDRIVTASEDYTARLWSRGQDGSWSSVTLQGHQGPVTLAAFSSTGDRIVTASDDYTARVWSRAQGGSWNSVPLQGHQNSVTSVTFSSDSDRIVTASADNTARIWSRGQDGSWNSVTLQGHGNPVNSAAFSPDGDRIVTSSSDNTARVWSRAQDGSWNSIPLQGHQNFVNSAAFSPAGDRIVTASDDNTARVWGRGQDGSWNSISLQGHQNSVTSAAFSPSGDRIVTASADNTVRVWDVRWLMGPSDWVKAEPLSLPETVCREKLQGSWVTAKDPKTGRTVQHIAARLLTPADIQAAPLLAGREGEDVCAPFVEHKPWWSRFAFWH